MRKIILLCIVLCGSTSIASSSNDIFCDNNIDKNIKACIEILSVDLSCEEEIFEGNYESCTVKIEHDVSSNYKGDYFLHIDIWCEVIINYGEKTISSFSYDNYRNIYKLFKNKKINRLAEFYFYFPIYRDIKIVKVKEFTCRIDDVKNYF